MLFQENVSVNMNQCNRFRNATVLYFVFHQDKVDASFCGRMFHPALLASNYFLFCLLKQGYLFNLLLLRHFASLRETLCLISVQLHKTRLDFLFVLADSYFIVVGLMKGQ